MNSDENGAAELNRERLELKRLQREIRKLDTEHRDAKYFSPVRTAALLLTVGLTIFGIFLPQGPVRHSLELQQRQVDLQQLQVELQRAAVAVAANEVATAFETVFAEPSGLALLCDDSSRGAPMLLLVDDEVAFPVIAELAGERLVPISRLRRSELPARINDMEIAASVPGKDCDDWQYVVASSHREYDDGSDTRVLRFRLEQDDKDGDKFAVRDAVHFSLAEGIAAYIQKQELLDISQEGENANRLVLGGLSWWEDNDGPHRYALELEGAVAVCDSFWVGLKFPQVSEQAVVLQYLTSSVLDVSTTGAPIEPIGHVSLPLDGRGISGMAAVDPRNRRGFDECGREEQEVLVVSNPLGGEPNGSMLHRFRIVGDQWTELGRSISVARPNASAEGAAFVDGQLWIAYDSDEQGIVEMAKRLPE